MNSSKANILNAICLIAIGLWGYIEVISPTALIPVGFGAALAFCIPELKKDNKVMAHIAVLLTFERSYQKDFPTPLQMGQTL